MSKKGTYKVTANKFVSNIVTNENGKIVRTEPILKWTLYRNIDDFMLKAFRRKWKVEKL